MLKDSNILESKLQLLFRSLLLLLLKKFRLIILLMLAFSLYLPHNRENSLKKMVSYSQCEKDKLTLFFLVFTEK